jgi:hypothetical protein
MGLKRVVKGLAAGAVLAAVASLIVSMKEEKNKKAAKELSRVAHGIKERVAKHAKKLGKLSKTAYNKIVDTTVAEYRGVKALSETDLTDMKTELKDSWSDVRRILDERKKCRPVKK